MTAPAVQPPPRERAPAQYQELNEQRYRQQVDEELAQKHDKRSNLRLGRGKSLVLSSPDGLEYAIALDDEGFITVTNYSTGDVGELTVRFDNVEGLAQEFIDVRAEFAAADGSLSTAYIAADAIVAADAASANASLSTTLTSAYQAADSTVASNAAALVATEASTRASADTAIASDVTALTARVTTAEGDINTVEATAAAIDGRLVTVEGSYATASSVSSLTATVNTKARTFSQTSAPTATATGDLWIDTDDNNRLYRWSGSAWVEVTDSRIAASASTLTTVTADITTLETAVADLDATKAEAATVSSLSATVSTIQTDLDTAEAAIVTNAAAITTEASARASGDSANATSISTLSASVSNPLANLIPNSTGANGIADWLNPTNWGVIDGQFVGRVIANFTTGFQYIGAPRANVFAGVAYTASVFAALGNTFGGYCNIAWYNSSDVYISESFGFGISSDVAEARYSGSATAPTGAVYARLIFGGTIGTGGRIVIWKAKLERNSVATNWNDDAALVGAFAAISTESSARASGDSANATSITTLTARTLNANANLIPNSSFFDNAAGWTITPGASVVTDQWGSQLRHPTADGTAASQIVVTNGITPGGSYVLSADFSIALSAGSAYCDVNWYNSSNVLLLDDSGPAAVNGQGFGNRKSTALTAPSGASYAIVRFVTEGVSGATLLAVRRIKLELGGSETAWSNEALDASLAASVTVNASAVADIEGRLAASYAIQVDGGGNGALISLEDGTEAPSAITLTADQITLDGDVIITGSITSTQLASGAVTTSAVDQTAAGVTMTDATWTDVASLSFTSVGIGVELRATCEVTSAGFVSGEAGAIEYRVLRDSTVLKSGTANVASETVDVGGGIFYLTKFASIIADYNDIPSSGTYTYKLQTKITGNTLGTPVRSTANRYLSAREFKR